MPYVVARLHRCVFGFLTFSLLIVENCTFLLCTYDTPSIWLAYSCLWRWTLSIYCTAVANNIVIATGYMLDFAHKLARKCERWTGTFEPCQLLVYHLRTLTLIYSVLVLEFSSAVAAFVRAKWAHVEWFLVMLQSHITSLNVLCWRSILVIPHLTLTFSNTHKHRQIRTMALHRKEFSRTSFHVVDDDFWNDHCNIIWNYKLTLR